MVILQILSDLHLEASKTYADFRIPPKAPHLALLGDIGCLSKDYQEYTGFLLAVLRDFKIVFLVLGNHEPYHSSWDNAKTLVREFQENIDTRRRGGEALGELVLLDQTRFDIDNGVDKVTILGCTLFSNIPLVSLDAVSLGLKDFKNIDNWEAKDHDELHQREAKWLKSQIQVLEGSGRKVVVLTHYSPTMDTRAQDPRHGSSPIASAFATDLLSERLWRSDSIKLWAYGHTHYNCDFTYHQGIRIFTNQRGYYFRQSAGFDERAVVEV